MAEPLNLAADLAEAQAIKERLTRLLIGLEQGVTGQVVTKPGAWRHHPVEWAEKYPLKANKST